MFMYAPSLSNIDMVVVLRESSAALFCGPVRLSDSVKLSMLSEMESSVMAIDTHDLRMVLVSVTVVVKDVKSAASNYKEISWNSCN